MPNLVDELAGRLLYSLSERYTLIMEMRVFEISPLTQRISTLQHSLPILWGSRSDY